MARTVAGSYDRLVKRLAAWYTALSPRTQDLALALALTAYYVGSLIPEAGQLRLPRLAFALVVLQTLPLIWRRRWPVATLLVIGIPRGFYDDLGIGFAPVGGGGVVFADVLRDRSFLAISAAFALGLFAQVGLLAHLVTRLAPVVGADGAALAVSLVTYRLRL